MLPVSDSRDRYKTLVHDEGVLRTLFKVIKSSTGSSMFDWVFITGVSPVVMSDITSGHNVARDIFFAPEFSDLCGFHEVEVKKTLDDIAHSCSLGEEKARGPFHDAHLVQWLRIYFHTRGAALQSHPVEAVNWF